MADVIHQLLAAKAATVVQVVALPLIVFYNELQPVQK